MQPTARKQTNRLTAAIDHQWAVGLASLASIMYWSRWIVKPVMVMMHNNDDIAVDLLTNTST